MHRCLKIFAKTGEEQVFSSEKEEEVARWKAEEKLKAEIRQKMEAEKAERLRRRKEQEEAERPKIPSSLQEAMLVAPEKPIAVTLSKQEAIAAVTELLEYYKKEEAQVIFRQTHREAEFALRPFLRRVKKVVHEMRKSTGMLKKYGFGEDEKGNEDFERAINKHATDLTMKQLQKDVLEVIMGDMNDVFYGEQDPRGAVADHRPRYESKFASKD